LVLSTRGASYGPAPGFKALPSQLSAGDVHPKVRQLDEEVPVGLGDVHVLEAEEAAALTQATGHDEGAPWPPSSQDPTA